MENHQETNYVSTTTDHDDDEFQQINQQDLHIWNQTMSYIKSESLRCAIQLGIPDAIHQNGKPMKLSDLVSALPIHPSKAPHLHRLMRTLVDSGFFVKLESKNENENESAADYNSYTYALTPMSRRVLKDAYLSSRDLALLMVDPVHRSAFHYLNEWFRNEDPSAFHTAYGMSYWDYAGRNPGLNDLFNRAMARNTDVVLEVLTRKWKHVFEGLTSVVDVGGGTGTLAMTIAKTFPHVKCTVLDLPHVIDGLQGTQNLEFVGGDMFKIVPSADAVVLKGILHDWDDEESVKILKRCKDAIPSRDKGGKVIIIELNNEAADDEENEKGGVFWSRVRALNDLQMMAIHGGKERSKKDWKSIFLAAGFSADYSIIPGNSMWSLMQVYP